MSLISKHTFTLLIVVALIFATGCDQRARTTKAHYGFADSITVDSLTLSQETDRTVSTAYVMDTAVGVYTLRGNHLYLDTVLKMADSAAVTRDAFNEYFSSKFYQVRYNGKQGYIRGTSLGSGLASDFDNDGRKDLILYGYTADIKDSTMEFPLNPLLIKFISAAGKVSELHDTAYSNIIMEEVDSIILSHKIHCYELNAGYPACGYPQYHFVIAYGNGKAEVIHRAVTSVDGEYGDFCEFDYPKDTYRHPDTIYISHKQALPLSDESDSVVVSTDSSILYLHKGEWQSTKLGGAHHVSPPL